MKKVLRVLTVLVCASALRVEAQQPNRVAWALKYDPRTFDPALTNDASSLMVRYLTAGVLLRQNRQTQAVEPALAERFEVSADGRLVTLHLRKGLLFSDGSPLTAADAVWSLNHVLAPATKAPVAEEFGGPGVTVDAADALTVRVHLPKRVVAILNVFDEIAIEPENRPSQGRVTSGSFTVADYRRGETVLLARNPHYWKHDAQGRQLPYLDGVQLDILANPEQNELRFLRGQYGVLDAISADDFAGLARKDATEFHDQGASLNTEQMWFNQAGAAPLPAWEKAWFSNRGFRQAVSLALRRQDMVRVAYDGHATVANGYISPANARWHDARLPPVAEDTGTALKLLAQEGFRREGTALVDREGHPVRFTLLTNAGNRAREKMGALIQQDLLALGMEVNVVTLDFPALIERLAHTLNYEAALLGLSNVDPDPSAMENVWVSSGADHQWNPGEKTPATPWEAELDRLMQAQSAAANFVDRKRAVDRVQEIVAEQLPFIYLVYPNTLAGVSQKLEGVVLTPLSPSVVANIDLMHWKAGAR